MWEGCKKRFFKMIKEFIFVENKLFEKIYRYLLMFFINNLKKKRFLHSITIVCIHCIVHSGPNVFKTIKPNFNLGPLEFLKWELDIVGTPKLFLFCLYDTFWALGVHFDMTILQSYIFTIFVKYVQLKR